MTYIIGNEGAVHLQSTLAACCHGEGPTLHHPILCKGHLELDPAAGEFRCPHITVPLDDWRTMQAIQQSVAILIMEIAGNTL